MSRISALDGLRGVAILLVVAFHSGWMPGGAHGVTVFFVLSGFLITRLIVAEIDAGQFNFRRFYWNRMVRLVPALLLMVTVSALFLGSKDWVWVVTYTSNYAGISGVPLTGLVHTWSLAVEEHFYLLWPVALVLIVVQRQKWIAGLLVAAVTWRLALLLAGANYTWIYASTDASAYSLLAGCFVAVVGWRPSKPLTVAAIVGLLMLLGLAPYHRGFGFLWIGFPVVALSALAVAGCATHRIRWLEFRWLTSLGIISYGVYLWHLPLINTGLPRSLALGLTLAFAVLSWRVVEQPIRRRFRLVRPVPSDEPRSRASSQEEGMDGDTADGNPKLPQLDASDGALRSPTPS